MAATGQLDKLEAFSMTGRWVIYDAQIDAVVLVLAPSLARRLRNLALVDLSFPSIFGLPCLDSCVTGIEGTFLEVLHKSVRVDDL